MASVLSAFVFLTFGCPLTVADEVDAAASTAGDGAALLAVGVGTALLAVGPPLSPSETRTTTRLLDVSLLWRPCHCADLPAGSDVLNCSMMAKCYLGRKQGASEAARGLRVHVHMPSPPEPS